MTSILDEFSLYLQDMRLTFTRKRLPASLMLFFVRIMTEYLQSKLSEVSHQLKTIDSASLVPYDSPNLSLVCEGSVSLLYPTV